MFLSPFLYLLSDQPSLAPSLRTLGCFYLTQSDFVPVRTSWALRRALVWKNYYFIYLFILQKKKKKNPRFWHGWRYGSPKCWAVLGVKECSLVNPMFQLAPRPVNNAELIQRSERSAVCAPPAPSWTRGALFSSFTHHLCENAWPDVTR